MNINNFIIPIIAGPTASGKTNLAIELAKNINGEIISADSRQVYKLLDIGTAKPSLDELNSIKHHLINILDPKELYSAGEFINDTNRLIKEILVKGKTPIIAGGTGLYIRSLINGIFEDKKDDKLLEIRYNLNKRLIDEGIDSLYKDLSLIDLDSAEKYLDKNPRRIIRALEYFIHTGEMFSKSQQLIINPSQDYQFKFYYINIEREILYKRINTRVDFMLSQGLLKEVESILNLGYSKELNSLNTVGYKEVINFFDGSISLEDAIDKIKQHSRNYAKRQITWFKKDINKVDLGIDTNHNLKIILDTLK